MAKDPISQVSGLNAGLDNTVKKLNLIESSLKKLSGLAGTTLKGVTSLLTPGVGQSTSMGLGTSGAQFSNGTGGSQSGMMPWLYSKKGAAAVGGVQFGLGAASGAYNAMPDLGLTVARATGFYQSALSTGGQMNRAGVAKATFSALGGGVTSPGSDQYVASILTQGYGYMPGTSDFNRAVKEVGGAARYLGMGNEAAAQAIGGFQTGSMGGRLYGLGISTFDPATGKARSTGDIVNQFYARFAQPGKQYTSEQINLAIRSGGAGAYMRAAGLSDNQISIVRQGLLDKAAGKKFDLENAPFNPDNPTNAQMTIATSMTSLMERGTTPMIAGFNDAATAAAALNAQLEKLPDGFFKARGLVQGMSNTNAGSLVGGIAGGIAAGVSTLAIGAGARKALAGLAAKGATNVLAGGGGAAASTVAKFGMKAALRAVPGVGTALLAYEGLKFLGKNMFGTPANAAQAPQEKSTISGNVPDKLITGNTEQQKFASDLLTKIGAPLTSENLKAMTTWMAYEGGHWKNSATYNPLNTTLETSASAGSMNSVGVQKYSSYEGGLSATAQTLNMDYYANVRKALYEGKDAKKVLNEVSASPWGTFKSGSSSSSSSISSSIGNKTVNINVNLANASVSEANVLAKKVKEILLNDKDLQTVGSK